MSSGQRILLVLLNVCFILGCSVRHGLPDASIPPPAGPLERIYGEPPPEKLGPGEEGWPICPHDDEDIGITSTTGPVPAP